MRPQLPFWLLAVIASVLCMLLPQIAQAADPTISSIANTSTAEEQAKVINFTVADTDGDTLTVTGTSSVPSLVPNASIVISGTGGARTATITPALDQSGSTTITLTVSDGSNTDSTQFVLQVTPVNDRPTISDVADTSTPEDQAKAISFTVADVDNDDATLTVVGTSSDDSLVPDASVVITAGAGGARTVTITPAANQFGSTTIRLTVSDGSLSAFDEFDLVVDLLLDDPPVIAGTTGNAFPDNAPADIFAGITGIEEIDLETVTATVNLDSSTVGSIVSAGGTTALPLPWNSANGTPAAVLAQLKALRFLPSPNRVAVGRTETVSVTLNVVDNSGMPAAQNGATTVTITSINDAPSFAFTSDGGTIPDDRLVQPLGLTLSDPDPGETFSATLHVDAGFGTLSGMLFEGTAAALQSGIENVRFTPSPQSATVTATFTFTLTEVHPPIPDPPTPIGNINPIREAARPPNTATIDITGVNEAPVIVGAATTLIRTSDDPLSPVLPFAAVRISDADPSQLLTVTISLDDPAKGLIMNTNTFSGTGSEVTDLIRTLSFVPTPNRIPVGQTENVTLTITVTDGSAIRVNDQTVIVVTSINGAPVITYTGPDGPGPGLPTGPILLDPSGTIKPFAEPADRPGPPDPPTVLAGAPTVVISDDDQNPAVTLTVTIDDPAKGGFASAQLGGFQSLGGGVYEFVGDPAAATLALSGLVFEVNPAFLFPANSPGGTTFTIRAADAALNRSSAALSILIQGEPRNHLVTRTDDDPSIEGTLRYAIANAGNNDTITFALPSYPARIRLANGPLSLAKNLTLSGPGANHLEISGDSDGNGQPDTQLFRIAAAVRVAGLTLKDGTALAGGCVSVGVGGSLLLEQCTVAGGIAEQWGGGVDVDGGSLTAIGCLFVGNATDSSFGFGGGAVSLFTNEACEFTNNTFSGNRQAAPNGLGGGAIYAENLDPRTAFDVAVSHCTFDENSDASDGGSSICANVFSTMVALSNSIFADGENRNLHVLGAGGIRSEGGNLSDDSTRTTLTQGGTPQLSILLSHADPVTHIIDDQTNTDPRVDALRRTTGPTRIHPLRAVSTAIGAAVNSRLRTDQLGALRDTPQDAGSAEFGSTARIVINEIHFDPLATESQFAELYNPRDSQPVQLANYSLWIDGQHRHTFSAATSVIQPGFGIIVADDPAKLADTTGAQEQQSSVVPGQATPLDLKSFGLIELRSPGTLGVTVASAQYNGVFAGTPFPSGPPVNGFKNHSLTLAPQFSGLAYVPSGGVGSPPFVGFDPDPAAPNSNISPGAESGGKVFGEANSPPIASPDHLVVAEDRPRTIAVLGNDFDADGLDLLDITGLPSDSETHSALGATVSIGAGSGLGGEVVNFDPRRSFEIQRLPIGVEAIDRFSYSIIDVGAGPINSYAHGGGAATRIESPAHRLIDADSIEISGTADPRFDRAHSVTVVDADSFTIPVAFPAITLYEAGGGNSTKIVSAAPHLLSDGDSVRISGSGDLRYNTVHLVSVVDDLSFTVPIPFIANPASPGVWTPIPEVLGGWVTTLPRMPSAPSTTSVEMIVVGANDPPSPRTDAVVTDEETIIRIMGDPLLAGSTTVTFDTDDLYPIPRKIFGGSGLLANDGDVDDDDSNASLKIVGVTQARAIAGYVSADGGTAVAVNSPGHGLAGGETVLISRRVREFEIENYASSAGGAAVAVTSTGHGLSDGDVVLISRYDGDPSYNGSHAVTVVDPDTFTIAVAFGVGIADPDDGWRLFSGDPGYSGFHGVQIVDGDTFTIATNFKLAAASSEDVWGILTDAGRLSTTSKHGATVNLEIRADRTETNIVYNPRTSSHLNGLALNEPETDTFWYAVEDSHGAVGLAEVEVNVTGVNDAPIPSADPPGIAGIDPALLGGQQLKDFLADVDVDYVVRGGGRGVAALLVGDPPDTLIIDRVWVTDEATEIAIARSELLANDRDIDRSDILSVSVGLKSTEGAELSTTAEAIIYKPRPSERLRKLSRGEWLVDTIMTTVTDSRGGSVPSLVAVLVVGLNETPVANPDLVDTFEDEVLVIGPPGVLDNDTDADRDDSAPDDDLTLIEVTDSPTSVEGARFSASGKTVVYDPTGSAFLDGLAEGQVHEFDTFDYTATDGSFVFATDDLFKVAADSAGISLDVLSNDRDLTGTGSTLTLIGVGEPSSGGLAVMEPDGSISYAPRVNFVGDEYFTYTARNSDGREDRALVVVRVTVDQLNGNLQANNDRFSIAKGQQPLLDVLANDNIIPDNGSGLTIESVVRVGPDMGGEAVAENGAIRYTPGDSLGYRSGDEIDGYEPAGLGAAKILSRSHRLASGDPIQISGSGEATYNGAHIVTVLDGDSFTIPVPFVPAAAPRGRWVTSRSTLRDTETFSYEISGGGVARATATVSLLVIDRENTLNVRDDALSVQAGSTDNQLFALANDNILPGTAAELTVAEISTPGHGSAQISADAKTILYTPAPGFIGRDSIAYQASDRLGGTGFGMVNITVGGLATNDDIFAVVQYKASNADDDGMRELDVLANDQVLQDIGGSVAVIGFTPPPNSTLGTMSVTPGGGSLTFQPADNTVGEEVYTYTIEDDTGGRASGQVTVIVIDSGLNASRDFFTVRTGSTDNQLDVLLNDAVAPDRGRALTIVAITEPPSSGGNAALGGDGTRIVYTPPGGFAGEEILTYSVTDGDTIDTATVIISVREGDLSPAPDAFTVYVGSERNRLEVLANDRILPSSGQILQLTGIGIDHTPVTNAPDQQGDAEISADGVAVEYTPRDLDAPFVERFTYEVSDGTPRRAAQTVTITVLNRTSTRDIDTNADAFTILQDSASNLLDVLANDNVRPASAAGWEITDLTEPAHGVASIIGRTVRYTPPAGFVGTVMFSYFVSDGAGGTGMADVTVKVGDNRLCDDQFVVLSGTADNVLDVLANDGILAFANEVPHAGYVLADDPLVPLWGQARVQDGFILYTPPAGTADPSDDFVGIDSFVYWVVDDSGGKVSGLVTIDVEKVGSDRSTARVSVVVKGVNDLPVISGLADATITDKQVIAPFAGVTLSDVDRQGLEALALTLELDPAMGILYHPDGLFVRFGNRYISAFMFPADATAALRGLLFQPTPGGRVSPDSPELIRITLEVNDGHAVVTDDSTTVTAQHPPQRKVLPVITATGADASMTDAEFGSAVSISGDTMAVGSWSRNVSGVDSGAVYIFRRVSAGGLDAWQQTRLVLPSDGSAGDLFGGSVALDGDTLVVGAHRDDVGGHQDAGSVYVFERNTGGPENWGQVKKLIVESAARNPGDQFGKSVAISGHSLLVGAPFSDRLAVDSGMARVFERNRGGNGNWGLLQEIVQPNPVLIDWFGGSVAIDGQTLIVGAYGSNRSLDNAGFDLGAAYIFDRDGPAAAPWQQTKKLERFADPRAMRDDNFGWAVDISGDTAIVGAYRFNPSLGAQDAGAAFLYRRDRGGDDNWGLLREMLGGAPLENERLGYSVAIDGSIALVGALSLNPATPAGFVQCYVRDVGTVDDWRFTDTLRPPDPDLASRFGFSVEVDGFAAAVGAPYDSDNPNARSRAGAVYTAQLQLRDPDAFAQFAFAWQVANFTLPVVQDAALEAEVWGLAADPDCDQYSNAMEMLMGTDPNQKDSDPNRIRFEALPDGRYSLVYQRSKDFPSEFVRSKWSSDLKRWNSTNVAETVEADLGAAEIIRATLGSVPLEQVFVKLVIGSQ